MKRKTDKIIIVEGKYDKIKLDSIIDGTVITTNGFRIFNDPAKRNMLRALAEKAGMIVLTDSDSAGRVIRNHLKTILPGADIKNAYLPPVPGKEKRKSAPSADGILGVEGQDAEIILERLEKAGAFGAEADKRQCLDKNDLYRLGLYGAPDSEKKRREILKKNGFPEDLSVNAFCEISFLLTFQ